MKHQSQGMEKVNNKNFTQGWQVLYGIGLHASGKGSLLVLCIDGSCAVVVSALTVVLPRGISETD